ncbi:MAG: ATP-grasp domain-containing protein [Oligoflexia bacterium]|nr:ATP-grasp domain-containing protein [Oligoflexia bacterium]MBF0365180.1 ATP-grasp domain-containing protein [Oligoflexia bacterium]
MKIVFTHNLKRSKSEEEAEFDSAETVAAIAEALKSLGHEVEPLETSGPASLTIARLEALNPDLVFNTSEGKIGRVREAFYPAIFEQLEIPFTGSDAYTCSVTLDKNLTKLIVKNLGVPVPQSILITNIEQLKNMNCIFPSILKPNYEGSSKGITKNSLVESFDELKLKIVPLLATYPSGVLVEEFVPGRDVTVPYLEGAATKNKGVLVPTEYYYEGISINGIYDYELKNELSEKVSVRAPAEISSEVERSLVNYSMAIFKALGIRDFGRIDYRITPDNRIYFLEINALPSLEPGAGIYLSASKLGLTEVRDVLATIIQSAVKRSRVTIAQNRKKFRKCASGNDKRLRIGLTYNEKRIIPSEDPLSDDEAEFDGPKTLNAIRDAIRSYGHELIDLEANYDLPERLVHEQVDLVFNIAEGIRGRYRESQVPALMELMDIPYTGSDAASLAIALDKSMAKRIVREVGILTPDYLLCFSGKEKLPPTLKFPLIVKPVAEGSSKGVLPSSVVHDEKELRENVQKIVSRYGQAALIENYLCGREFTVALLGEKRPKSLPPMEIVFANKGNQFPVYSYQHKLSSCKEIYYEAPAKIDDKLKSKLESAARKSFMALGCRDVARIDLRLDNEGRVNFIECNPLPGLTPGWSDLCLIADSYGMSYRTLIGEILAPAIRRYKENKRSRLQQNEGRVLQEREGLIERWNKIMESRRQQQQQVRA